MTNSPPHVDITLSLLRKLSGPAPDATPLERVSWERVVAFSSSHFILQALADPLGASKSEETAVKQAHEFFLAIRDANADRNAMLLGALREAANALGEIGVVPCALKGAAFLATAEATAAPAPWRFMSDLDLLVPEDRLAACVEAMSKLGFKAASSEYEPDLEAHFPPLISPCRTFSVELHTRLFGLDDFGLAPEYVWADATPVSLGQAEILVPSLIHRIAHVLLHAQLHNRNHVIHRIVLKDVLDLTMLARQPSRPIDWQRLLSSLRHADRRQPAAALLAVWQSLTGARIKADLSPAAIAWANRATARLHWPLWCTMLALPLDVLRMEYYRLRSERGHLRRRLKLLTDTARIREVYTNWSGKQRQRVWG